MFGDDNNNNIYVPNILFIHFIFPFIAEYKKSDKYLKSIKM